MSRVVDIPGWDGYLVGGFRELEAIERRQFRAIWDQMAADGEDPDDIERHVCAAMIAAACVALTAGPFTFCDGFNDPGFAAMIDAPSGTLPVDLVVIATGEHDGELERLARAAVGRRSPRR